MNKTNPSKKWVHHLRSGATIAGLIGEFPRRVIQGHLASCQHGIPSGRSYAGNGSKFMTATFEATGTWNLADFA